MIDSQHTYYVEAGNDPVLVHNCGTDSANIPGVPLETSGLSLDEARAAGFRTELPEFELAPPVTRSELCKVSIMAKSRTGRWFDVVARIRSNCDEMIHGNPNAMPGDNEKRWQESWAPARRASGEGPWGGSVRSDQAPAPTQPQADDPARCHRQLVIRK